MIFNNRQPVFQEKEYEYRKVFHTEVKDGKTIFVEGKAPNPYKDVKCESLSLQSRIETGVFQDMEGSPRHLEKASGSDIMTEEIRKAQEEYNNAKDEEAREQARKRYDELFEAELKKREKAAKED